MLKKNITYTDYDGNERSEDFYFNLSKAELTEMQLSQNGGLEKLLQKIIAEQDSSRIVTMFKDIIRKSYGEKSLDGKRFIKFRDGHSLFEEFEQTEAYSVLFMELATDAEAAAAFINGIIPKDLADQIAAEQKKEEQIAKLTGETNLTKEK